jgi:hypothetical protein
LVQPAALVDGDPEAPGGIERQIIGAGEPAAGRGELNDLTPEIIGPAVHGIKIVGIAALILGQTEIELASARPVLRVDRDALGPVHRRGAEEIGGAARLDDDIGL